MFCLHLNMNRTNKQTVSQSVSTVSQSVSQSVSHSLSRINPNSKSVIIVGGDFNLGHMDWETLSVFPGKPNQKQHQQFLDIINDNSLTQVTSS